MTRRRGTYKRLAEITSRIAQPERALLQRCTVLGCGRPTRWAAGNGLDGAFCRYHSDRRRRFGSAFAPTIRATDLRPYVKTALSWIREHRAADAMLGHVVLCLRGLLDGAGPVDRADYLKGQSAAYRARVAFARLREAGVVPERLLAVHLGVAAIIEDDRESHRVEDYRLTQIGKALHRLASGSHSRWEYPQADGSTRVLEAHRYPRSSGRVLREIGKAVDELCFTTTDQHRDTIRRLKLEKYGPHPSQLPGWLPAWRRQLDAAGAR